MAIIIDLFTRKILYNAPVCPTLIDSSEDEIITYAKAKERIETRFGNNIPKHFVRAMAKPQSKPYKYGDVHNVSYKTKTKHFNSPFPVPCEVTIESCAKRGRVYLLGDQCMNGFDEPMPWMELKYRCTYRFLSSLPEGSQVLLITRSDLVGHDDYVSLFKRLNICIQILYSNTDSEINRRMEPGAPSYDRRVKAMKKLRKLGISVRMLKHNIERNVA